MLVTLLEGQGHFGEAFLASSFRLKESSCTMKQEIETNKQARKEMERKAGRKSQ
jgi:hypothetical protein